MTSTLWLGFCFLANMWGHYINKTFDNDYWLLCSVALFWWYLIPFVVYSVGSQDYCKCYVPKWTIIWRKSQFSDSKIACISRRRFAVSGQGELLLRQSDKNALSSENKILLTEVHRVLQSNFKFGIFSFLQLQIISSCSHMHVGICHKRALISTDKDCCLGLLQLSLTILKLNGSLVSLSLSSYCMLAVMSLYLLIVPL